MADYVCDGIYVFDTLVIRTRLQFLDEAGIYEKDRGKTIRNFIRGKGTFKVDLVSLLPLDLFYFVTGFTGRASLLRLPRLLRL